MTLPARTTDEFIKDRTRLWRESWIVKPLRAVLGDDA